MNKNRTENYVDGEITEAKLDATLQAKVNGVGLNHTHTLSQVTDAGDSAGLDVGTGAGTVAAGDHAHADLAPLASPTFTGTVTAPDIAANVANVFNVKRYGATGNGTTDDTAAIQAAITAIGNTEAVLYFPAGIYLTTGISLYHTRIAIRGAGCGYEGLNGGSVLKGKAGITGPVLDLRGMYVPEYGGYKREFSNFSIYGSGEAIAATWDPANATTRYAKAGIVAESDGLTGPDACAFRNVSVSNTGGPGIYAASAMTDWQNVTVQRPVSAGTNDVPYIYVGSSNNAATWSNVGLVGKADPDPVSGCWRFDGVTGTWPVENNLLTGCWSQGLHIPENGSVVSFAGVSWSVISDWQANDTNATTEGQTGSCFFRIGVNNSDVDHSCFANIVRGPIPGRRASGGSVAYGVILADRQNTVQGVRRDDGYQVLIAATNAPGNCHVALDGGTIVEAGWAAVVNDSAATTNVIRVDNVYTGTVTAAGFTGPLTGNVTGTASGNLTSASNLDATKLTGTVADARLSANVPLLNAASTTFTNNLEAANLISGTWRTSNYDVVLGGGFIGMKSAYSLMWSSTTDYTGTKDAGIDRVSPGVLRINNGSTGLGSLGVATLGVGNSAPAASAALDVTSTTKGFLPPRMTTTQREAITSPAEGLTVYDLTLHKLYCHDGTAWQACW